MKKRILNLAGILALVVALVVPVALVYAETGSVTVSGGSLSVTTAAVTLSTTTLTGAELTATSAYGSNLWTANDPRGTGAGWRVTVLSTDFGSPANEKQTITITGTATGGTFTLTYGTKTTAAIDWNATNAVVKSTLEALTNIGTVTVTGGVLPTAVVVEFVDPGNQVVALMTATSLLTGTSPVITITETTAGAPGIDISATDQEFKILVADANITVVNGSAIEPTASLSVLTAMTGSAMTIVTAAVVTGMGNYNIPPSFELEIPAETYAGTYTATLTVAIVTGP